MGRVLRRIGLVVVVLLVVAGGLVLRTLNAGGYFKTVVSSFSGTCTAVSGVVGAEDMELDRRTGELFISSQDRRRAPGAGEGAFKQGEILLAHVDRPDEPPVSLTRTITDTLHPHGISLFADAAGNRTLAVINHNRRIDVALSEILLFDVVDHVGGLPQLVLRRRVADPLIHDPNDITLVSRDAFYVTNDHGSQTSLGRTLEDFLLLPRGDVVFYDGKAAKVAASGFNFTNGINHSADLATIYVAESTGRTVDVMHRDMTTGTLSLVRSIFLDMGPDNIDVDPDGNLWIAGHPKLLDFLAHAQDATKIAPSEVVKVDLTAEQDPVKLVYMNTGEEISASSIAIYDGKRLAIGAVFDAKYLNCDYVDRTSTSTRSDAP